MASHSNLPNELTLLADGVEVPLPHDSQGIILLNIDSYGGGVPMWSHGVNAETNNEMAALLGGTNDVSASGGAGVPRRVQSLG